AGPRQLVEGAHRHVELVGDAADVHQHLRRVLRGEPPSESADQTSLPLSTRKPFVESAPSLEPWAWQIAQASASAASGAGSPGRACRRRTMCCTCRFPAWPLPTTDCLTWSAVYSEAGDPQPGIDAEDSQSITAVVYTSCTSSRLSSASSSRRRLAASPPASELSAFGLIVISASSGLRPAFCIAAFTVAKSAGAQITSTEPSSFLSTSSAPASSAASMTRSSLVPGANTNWPTWRNR